MSFPASPFLDITTLAERWAVKPMDVVAWAVAGHLRIALPLPPVKTAPGRIVSGLVEVDAAECYRLFRNDPLDTVVIHRIRPIGSDDWETITDPNGGVRITRLDLVVTAADIARIEARPGGETAAPVPLQTPAEQKSRPNAGRPQGTSAHDWDAFHAQVTKLIHDQGIPKTMADLARHMENWFADRNPGCVPDLSTIRKKLRPVWNELRAA